MKVFTTFILAGFTLILTSCSKPQQHDIVGRWHEVGTTSLGAFHEDGTIELSSGEGKLSGKYSFITDGKIKIELSGKGEALGPTGSVYPVVPVYSYTAILRCFSFVELMQSFDFRYLNNSAVFRRINLSCFQTISF